MIRQMIAFLFYKLFFSASSFAGSRRQASVKTSLPTLGKASGPKTEEADNQSIIGAAPGPDAVSSLRSPVRQGKIWICRPPSATGDRVGVLAPRRQPVLAPAIAAVSGTKDLTTPRHAVDLVGVARVERDTHHRRFGLDPMVEAPPAAASIRAAVERAIGALRGWTEAGIEHGRVVRRHPDV